MEFTTMKKLEEETMLPTDPRWDLGTALDILDEAMRELPKIPRTCAEEALLYLRTRLPTP